MSWMSEKTGRPKEEGGHKRVDISLDKETRDGLEKIRKGGGNASQFVEEVAKPKIRALDPGPASQYIWTIQTYVTQVIIEAAQQGRSEVVQAMGTVMDKLKHETILCGLPPQNFEASLQEKFQLTEHERELRELEAKMYAIKEEFLMDEDKYNSESIEEKAKRRQKYRKIVGLV